MLSGTGVRAWLREPPHVDWLVAAGALLLAAVSYATTTVPMSPADRVVVVAAILLQAAALLRRRRAPVAVLAFGTLVLLATTLVVGDPVATELPVILMVYAVAAHRPARITWAGVAAVFIVVTLTYPLALRVPASDAAPEWATAAVTQGVGFLVSLLAAVGVGLTVRGRRQQIEIQEERTRQLALEREQHAQLEVLAERERMAREMHDLVAHSVAVMVTLAHGASSAMERNPEMARRALDELTRTGSESLRDMRRVLGLLRDGGTDGDGVASQSPEAIADLVATFRGVGLPVQLSVVGEPPESHSLLHHTVYRVVQECLTNVLRHAPGSDAVDVSLEWGDDVVTIEVRNTGDTGPEDGSGRHGGHGLRGLRERVAAFAGSVEAGPLADGWRVRATLNHGDN